jgi:hypothetical protein
MSNTGTLANRLSLDKPLQLIQIYRALRHLGCLLSIEGTTISLFCLQTRMKSGSQLLFMEAWRTGIDLLQRESWN